MEIKPHYSAPLCRHHTGNCCVEAVDMVPMGTKDVYLQNGCWHALGDGAVDHSEAPFHGCMELLLASLQGQGDPSCSAEAPSELSVGWLRVHAGMNDAKGQRQAQDSKHGCTVCNKRRETRQVGELKRRGSFLPQRPWLWQKLLAKKVQDQLRDSKYEDR